MVNTYSQHANPNMRRPVVKPEIVDFMRQRQAPVTDHLKILETFAKENNVPVIPHETVAFFRLMLESMEPKSILEIGTAIGFSTLLMAHHAPEAKITTIDRNPEMIALAKENFKKYDNRQQVTLLEGEALEILPDLQGQFDFVFMDSAKSKYIVFLPEILKRTETGGLILIDDVFQGGDVALPFEEIKRGQRAIYKGLQALFDATLNHPDLTVSVVPLGDGLLMIRKKSENVVLPD
ncbi:O-methyltransferase [Streptococcus rifensis]